MPCVLSPVLVYRRILGGLLVAALSATSAAADDPKPVDFGRQIRPLLAKNCYKCHGPDKHEGGLRLNSASGALAKVESGGHAIVRRDVAKSLLVARITSQDPAERMPQEAKPLASDEIDLLRRWIAEGARWEEHWAFQPLTHPVPPEVKDQQWVRTAIDAFVLARLEKSGLAPSPPASRTELARRVYYDLTGLPPTPADIDAFVADRSPDAYERLVDSLLASPRYGEQWARHWLDVVRYADTNSFERDAAKPFAWRYRDYVIRSLNDDKPYDQFVREQLAGDELPQLTADGIIATGYYRLGLWDDEPADDLAARHDELDDIVTTTGQAFLGLTVNCARCHDHKIDPIPQRDYYRLLAFFSGITRYGERGGTSLEKNSLRTLVDENKRPLLSDPEQLLPPGEAAMFRVRREKIEKRLHDLEGLVRKDLNPTEKDEFEFEMNRPGILNKRVPRLLTQQQADDYPHLLAARDAVRYSEAAGSLQALCVSEKPGQPPTTHVMQRGNPRVPGERVEPGFPAVLDPPAAAIPKPAAGAKTSGRRLALAQWIAAPDNRLTARVMVNRIWQHHFGRGIVRSPNNFGLLGDPPTHPELLDYLAGEFTRGGWRMKSLHRLILLSSAYQMSSRGNPAGVAKDPENNLFWRFNPRRLTAEELRDSMLAVTGQLNLKMYGPGFFPVISREVMAGQSVPGAGWGQSSPAERSRRSIYIHVKRSLVTPLLASFDFPETDGTCEARFATTQPAQALAMINGDFVNVQARVFAERLQREAGDKPEARVRLALRLALCRPPDEAATARGLKLIESLRRDHASAPEKALDYFCLMVLNLNEFVYLD